MLALTLDNERRLLPDSWQQAGALGWPLLRDLARYPGPEGRARALRRLTGLDRHQWSGLSETEVDTLVAGLPWLALSPIDAPLQARLRHRLRTYHWPAAGYLDGHTLDFVLADEYFLEAVQGGDDAARAIDLLLAVLARPTGSITTRPTVEARADRLAGVGPEWRMQALMYWMGTKRTIDELYGDFLFRGTAGSGEVPSTAPSFGWWSVLQDVAEAQVFGDILRVYAAPFHDVCQYLVRKEGQRRDQLRALEASRPKK